MANVSSRLWQDSSGVDPYEALRTYNFAEDEEFLAGWRTVRSSLKAQDKALQDRLLDLKIFYFNRKYQYSLDKHSYLEWLNSSASASAETPRVPDDDALLKEMSSLVLVQNIPQAEGSDPTEDAQSDIPDQSETEVQEGGDVEADSMLSGDARDPSTPEKSSVASDALTFTQLMELVQAGKQIPGVEELNIEATNAAPTPSVKEAVKKPWEM